MRAVARWAPLAAALGVAIWLVLPACTSNPVAGVDVYMHVRRVEFGIEALLSRGSIDPWFPGAFVGFPLFAARGPGLTVASALVTVLGLGAVRPIVALNVVVLGSLALVPLAVAYAARGFHLGRRAAGLAALLSLLLSYPYTEGPVGLFGIGLLENQLGAVFGWMAIGALRRLLVAPSLRAQVIAIGSLAALVVTHTASTVALVSIAALTVLGTSPRRLVRTAASVMVAGLLAAMVAGFWLVPFLAHRALVDVVIAGHGIPPVPRELVELFRGPGALYVPHAAWVVGGAWLIVATTWRRWPAGVLLAMLVPALYFASTRLLYHAVPRELTEQLARRGMGYCAVIATFPLAALGGAAMRRLGSVGTLLLTALVTAAVAVSIAPMRRVVGPHVAAPDPLPAVASVIEDLVPPQGRFSTSQGGWGRYGFPAPDRWLAWASHRNVLAGHTPASSSMPWTITLAERYETAEPTVLANRLQRLGVTHVVMPTAELTARLAASPRFRLVREIPPMAVLALQPVPGFPGPETLITTSRPAAVDLVRYDTEGFELTVRMSADGTAVLALPWWPRWTGTMDGRPLSLRRDSDGLTQIVLPGGEHRVRLRYRPDGWDLLGRGCSLLGLLALTVLCLRRRPTVRESVVPSKPPE